MRCSPSCLVLLTVLLSSGLCPAKAQSVVSAAYRGTIVEIIDWYGAAPPVTPGMGVTGSFFYEVCPETMTSSLTRYYFNYGSGAMRNELRSGPFSWDITTNPGSYTSNVAVDLQAAPTGLRQIYVLNTSVSEGNYTTFSGAIDPSFGSVHNAITVSMEDNTLPLTFLRGSYLPTGSNDINLPAATSMQVRVHSHDSSNDDEWTIIVDITQIVWNGPGLVNNYCTSSPNSVGPGALITLQGSNSLSIQDLSLVANGCVPDQFGLFFYGQSTGLTPFGQGSLCISAASPGLFRLSPPTLADSSGTALHPIDWNSGPVSTGPGEILAGSTWHFQYFYRDPTFGFNLSDAVSIEFCP